jgi:hypothetical protein
MKGIAIEPFVYDNDNDIRNVTVEEIFKIELANEIHGTTEAGDDSRRRVTKDKACGPAPMITSSSTSLASFSSCILVFMIYSAD